MDASHPVGEQPEAAEDMEANVEADVQPDEEPEEAEGIRYEENRLTARVSGMSLHALLMEVGRQSGARVVIEGAADRTVTETFTRLPLDEALRRVLTDENFSLIYGTERGPKGESLGTRLKDARLARPTSFANSPDVTGALSLLHA